jgi:hypothetical protein
VRDGGEGTGPLRFHPFSENDASALRKATVSQQQQKTRTEAERRESGKAASQELVPVQTLYCTYGVQIAYCQSIMIDWLTYIVEGDHL